MKTPSIVILAALFAGSIGAYAQEDFDVVGAWEKDCQKCHADNGSGLTKKGRKLRVRDYRKADVQAEMKDSEMADAIKNGIEKDGEEIMNPYADSYTENEINAFISYIRGFAK